MYKSLEKQIRVMGLLRQGKNTVQIQKEVKIADSTIGYIRQHGPDNVNRLIDLLKMAVENQVMEEEQIRKLRAALGVARARAYC
jgi:uncharacterized protein YerC